jgi:hypothetical protein
VVVQWLRKPKIGIIPDGFLNSYSPRFKAFCSHSNKMKQAAQPTKTKKSRDADDDDDDDDADDDDDDDDADDDVDAETLPSLKIRYNLSGNVGIGKRLMKAVVTSSRNDGVKMQIIETLWDYREKRTRHDTELDVTIADAEHSSRRGKIRKQLIESAQLWQELEHELSSIPTVLKLVDPDSEDFFIGFLFNQLIPNRIKSKSLRCFENYYRIVFLPLYDTFSTAVFSTHCLAFLRNDFCRDVFNENFRKGQNPGDIFFWLRMCDVLSDLSNDLMRELVLHCSIKRAASPYFPIVLDMLLRSPDTCEQGEGRRLLDALRLTTTTTTTTSVGASFFADQTVHMVDGVDQVLETLFFKLFTDTVVCWADLEPLGHAFRDDHLLRLSSESATESTSDGSSESSYLSFLRIEIDRTRHSKYALTLKHILLLVLKYIACIQDAEQQNRMYDLLCLEMSDMYDTCPSGFGKRLLNVLSLDDYELALTLSLKEQVKEFVFSKLRDKIVADAYDDTVVAMTEDLVLSATYVKTHLFPWTYSECIRDQVVARFKDNTNPGKLDDQLDLIYRGVLGDFSSDLIGDFGDFNSDITKKDPLDPNDNSIRGLVRATENPLRRTHKEVVAAAHAAAFNPSNPISVTPYSEKRQKD